MENNKIINFKNLLNRASYIKKNSKKLNSLSIHSNFKWFSSIFMEKALPAYIPQEIELALSFSNMVDANLNLKEEVLLKLYKYLLIDYIATGKCRLNKVMINESNRLVNPIMIVFNFESYIQACEKGRREEIENHLEVFINLDYYLHLINKKNRLTRFETEFLFICNNVITGGHLLRPSDLVLINDGKVKFINNKTFISKFKFEAQRRDNIIPKSKGFHFQNLSRILNYQNLKENKDIVSIKSLKILYELVSLK